MIRNREQLTTRLLTPREQKLMQEQEILLQRIKSLENQLAFVSDKMKQLPNFKLYERITKVNLKAKMKEKARTLREQGIGYGTIAEKINEEFNTQFSRGTIKYWLDNSQ